MWRCGPIVGISNFTNNRDHRVGLGIVSSELAIVIFIWKNIALSFKIEVQM